MDAGCPIAAVARPDPLFFAWARYRRVMMPVDGVLLMVCGVVGLVSV
jgi:hypothetical protein